MKNVLETLQQALQAVRAEKNQAVKAMVYDKAEMLFSLEKSLVLKIEALEADMSVIHRAKTYTREEVVKLIEKYHQAWVDRPIYEGDEDPPIPTVWIQDNL